MTDFSKRCEILNQVDNGSFLEEQAFSDFIDRHDLTIPLAMNIFFGMAEPTEKGTNEINATWEALLSQLGIEDKDYNNFREMLVEAGWDL